jgi:Common central domain of tyrosinase/Polyphenol oxidase middle domain
LHPRRSLGPQDVQCGTAAGTVDLHLNAGLPPKPIALQIRRDIWALELTQRWHPVTLSYARAVAELQRRPAGATTIFRYHADLHGRYCQHANWFFLPWHRMYIFWFERIVRRIVREQGGPADWGLPYWNYSRGFPTNTLPPPFREPFMPDGRPNPLFLPEPARNPAGINRGGRLPERSVETSTALSLDTFSPPPPPGFGGSPSVPVVFPSEGRRFAGALEVVPHNVVHDLVGGRGGAGFMSEPARAAHDPIFWLHHSNIDRVWARWRAAGGADPVDRRFLDQQFGFVDENGGWVWSRVADVLDPVRLRNLDYRYDDEPPVVAPRPLRPPAAVSAASGSAGGERQLAASDSLELGAEPAEVVVALPDEARDVVRSMLAPGVGAGRVQLVVEGITADEDPGIVYEVHVGVPGEAPEEGEIVGYVTFFGVSHAGHEGHGGLNHAFDITALVERLEREGRWKTGEHRVSFVPRGLEPPPGEEAPPGEGVPPGGPRGIAPGTEPRARIGRVTLTAFGAGAGAGPEEPWPEAEIATGFPTPGEGEILAWEDDPGEPPPRRTPIRRPVPRLEHATLPIRIVDAPPRRETTVAPAALRWWSAADALARARDAWASVLPAGSGWVSEVGSELPVRLDSPEPQFNAFYDRAELAFFHDTIRGVTCWSGESPDVVCHELGHAILDLLRPQLWDAAGVEPAAFHECFGDLTALVGALQLPSLREAVLDETSVKVWRSSRMSRVAEQLGWAIRQGSPGRAEPEALRDASNSWFYRDPAMLPPEAPASVLSTEPHFFARIFTGAVLKAVAGMYDVETGGARDPDALLQVSTNLTRLLVEAVLQAPVVPSYFSQVAAHMLAADSRQFGGRYREALRFGFVRHGVLALSSATELPPEPEADQEVGAAAAAGDELPRSALAGEGYGLPGALVVQACGQRRRFGVAGAAPDRGAVDVPSGDRAAELFVEDLFRQGRVDVGAAAAPAAVTAPNAYKTHRLAQADSGRLELRRRVFDCGFHPTAHIG